MSVVVERLAGGHERPFSLEVPVGALHFVHPVERTDGCEAGFSAQPGLIHQLVDGALSESAAGGLEPNVGIMIQRAIRISLQGVRCRLSGVPAVFLERISRIGSEFTDQFQGLGGNEGGAVCARAGKAVRGDGSNVGGSFISVSRVAGKFDFLMGETPFRFIQGTGHTGARPVQVGKRLGVGKGGFRMDRALDVPGASATTRAGRRKFPR